WRTIIENQATSGVSIAAYCRNAQIKPSYFYTWRCRLREQQSSAGGFIELIPGRLTNAASGISIRLGVRLCIEVDREFDPHTLRAVVETLSTNRCSA
ncbi:hypothetical protein, partial [Brevundimonas sp.]|uniref:IS66 family insertion sequence element accessory protein TnpA n=1 Tax=Brevundimonas sp. TaxID=1871086 RepID=UPI0027303B22